jgi:hypothetical protein
MAFILQEFRIFSLPSLEYCSRDRDQAQEREGTVKKNGVSSAAILYGRPLF